MGTAADTLALARKYFDAGHFSDAQRLYKLVLQVDASSATAWCHLGAASEALGQYDDAVLQFQRALCCDSRHAEAICRLESALAQRMRLCQALGFLAENPRQLWIYAQAHFNLGTALTGLGQPERAMAHFQLALALKPDHADAHNNLGNLLYEKDQFAEAAASFRQALRWRPNHFQAHYNLGTALMDLAQFDQALACFEEALRHQPQFATAHWDRSLVWLLQGDFERGWPEYEWRWTQPEFTPRNFSQPRWDGANLRDRTLLIFAEQGLGDTLQFLRYLPLLKQRCSKLIFECQAPLLRLLAGYPGIDHLVGQGSALPPFAAQAPLLSVPGILGTSLANIPAAVPYLEADAKLVERWRRELEPLGGFKVGIAWQGNPNFRDDRQRSIKLTQFEPLAKVPGVRLVSLQKGPGAEQLHVAESRFAVVDWTDRLDESSGPFMDTAAIVKNLNLVICSDSAIAHLASALGKPVWVALPLVPDWRWLLEREDSPWYPTMRLFRQSRLGDWNEVFVRIADALLKVRVINPVVLSRELLL